MPLPPARDEADARTADARDRAADILEAAAEQAQNVLTSTAADRAKALRLLQIARRRAAHLVIEAKLQARENRATAEAHAHTVLQHATRQADDFVTAADERAAAAREAVRQARRECERILADARHDAEQHLSDARDRAQGVREQADAQARGLLKKAAADAEQRVLAAQETAAGTQEAAREEADRIIAAARESADVLRTQAAAQADEALRKARAHAGNTVAEARKRAEEMQHTADGVVREATATAERLRRAAEADTTSARARAEKVLSDVERLRQEAQEDADAVRGRADLDAARLTAVARREADDYRQVALSELDQARTESERILNAAQAARERAEEREHKAVEALAEAVAKREAADERWRAALSSTQRRLQRRQMRRQARDDRRAAVKERKEQARQRRRERRAQHPSLGRRMAAAGAWGSRLVRNQARRVLVSGPILAPMAVAWWSQTDYAVHTFGWWPIFGLGFAAAWELTTAFTGWMYHRARRMGDGGLIHRIATWIFAAGAAAMNYAHHCGPGGRPTQPAIAFATMSVVGMALWELYALLVHRQYLREQGMLPQPRPRLGLIRWVRFTSQAWTAWSLTINDSSLSTVDLAWKAAAQKLERRAARRSVEAALRNAEANDRAALKAGLTMQRLVVPRPPVQEDPRAGATAVPLFQPASLPFRSGTRNTLPTAPAFRNVTGGTDSGPQPFHERAERNEAGPALLRSSGTLGDCLAVPAEHSGDELEGTCVPDHAEYRWNASAVRQRHARRAGTREPEHVGVTSGTPESAMEHPAGTAISAARTADADRGAFHPRGTDRRNALMEGPERPTSRLGGTDRSPGGGAGTDEHEPVISESEQAAVDRLREAGVKLSKRAIAAEVRNSGGTISDKRAGTLAVRLAKLQMQETAGI
ncbi:hypothetical protein ACH4PU_31170 [Streptomyces sp. NPDC021100]|uniref:hypothetical protein n=1 Tax=Streptomyces sp. NPDC021100 TaxID=3365114 RepID=UPI0037BE1E1E